MRVAIYPSVLYGDDFIVESINSILPHVEQVFVVMMSRPWGDTDGVNYKGTWVPWPAQFDRTREKIAEMANPKVTVLESYKSTPWNRWGFGFECVAARCEGITEVMFIDPDCVFHDLEALRAFQDWEAHPEYAWASVDQIELWRTPAWRVVRPRAMVSLHRGNLSLLVANTADTRPLSHPLQGRVHNLGFCCSERNTRWKHLCSMAFSPVVNESLPNPDWYERTWLNWHPTTNNKNLEVSLGCEHAIPRAVPYDVSGLPASIKWRYDSGEWSTYGAAK